MEEEKYFVRVLPMASGSMAADGGYLFINSREKYEDFIKREPKAKKFIKRFIGGDEFINNIERWCLWLVDAKPQELHDMKHVMERVEAVKKFRLESKREATKKRAETPWLFAEIRQPTGTYIAIPKTSSENRYYIPMGYLDDSVIPGDALRIIPGGGLYQFGILMSRVHMAWVRVVAGRLKSDYRYSNTVVYNNFPWPFVTDSERARISSTAQKILGARALYPESSLASLYNDSTMPPELRKAHRENDIAVCEAYCFDKNVSEEDILPRLFWLYEAYTDCVFSEVRD